MGISAEKMDKLFIPFCQAQEGQAVGTGLGLYGLRNRVEALGGSCGAHANEASSTGSGTVFWFAIPYVADRLLLQDIDVAESCSKANHPTQGAAVDDPSPPSAFSSAHLFNLRHSSTGSDDTMVLRAGSSTRVSTFTNTASWEGFSSARTQADTVTANRGTMAAEKPGLSSLLPASLLPPKLPVVTRLQGN